MNSPIASLAWEIWHRGRRSARLVLGCVALCSLLNLVVVDRLHADQTGLEALQSLFGLLMAVSFLLLMGIFNYTEYNSTKDWNGFPYRLFVLPVRTWQLVAMPILLAVLSVELTYTAWIKLVWTHKQIPLPEWFAVVLGAYVVFYQTTLWCLAGLRIMRIVALSFGGVTVILVGFLPFSAENNPSPWLSEKRLISIMVGLALIAFITSWAIVSRQRCGGGRRRGWIKALVDRISDALPRRTRDFGSPAEAQFWFEWRRVGFLLPVCTAFALLLLFAPVSWAFRTDPGFTVSTVIKTLAVPIILAFVIGKGFIKPEFWSMKLSIPTFLAVQPMPAGQFVASKMKVAALSVAISWLLVLCFLALWLPLWANTLELQKEMFMFRQFYPNSWQVILVLCFAGLAVLTWRCMISGLWVGLSGNRAYYIGSACLQGLIPILALLVIGIWSKDIDSAIQKHPELVKSGSICAIGWLLAFLVIIKIWFAVFSWSDITPRRTRQYLLLWSGATLTFVALALLIDPPLDIYRQEHLYVLAALLFFPMARLGLAPRSLAKNRHGCPFSLLNSP